MSLTTSKRSWMIRVLLPSALCAGAACGQIITVDTSFDVIDFGGAQTTDDLPGPDGKVSLREAGLASDNTQGVQTIAFNVPMDDWQYQWLYPGRVVLRPFLGLRVFDAVIIDATTQTEYTGDTNPDGGEVVIWEDFYVVNTNGSEVRGFDSSDIAISGGSNNVIQRNTLTHISVFGSSDNLIGGTGPDEGNTGGTIKIDRANHNVVVGNTYQRIRVLGGGSTQPAVGNRIGGPNLEDRNYITGYGTWNSEGLPSGTTIQLFHTLGTVVENNWIGTTPDGMSQGNFASIIGVSIEGENRQLTLHNNRIAGILGQGRPPHHAGQLFGWAILISGDGSDVVITGNRIGLNADDEPVLGSVWGIDVGNPVTHRSRVTDLHIGRPAPTDQNVIGGHRLNGITVGHDSPPVRISGNSILENGWLGIDLIPTGYGYGPDLNDPLDADTGANGLQNYPEIAWATSDGLSVQVVGLMHSKPSKDYTLEFFASSRCDDSGFGPGEMYLGSTAVTTNGSGDAPFDVELQASIPSNWVVTATATQEPIGATSEFSPCVPIESGVDIAEITAVQVSTGELLDGAIPDLLAPDDSYVLTRSGFGQTLIDLHNMSMLVSANTNVQSPSTIDLTIETRISHPTGTMQVRLRNWNSNAFDLVGTRAINDTDHVFSLNDIDSTNYIDPGTGNINLQLKQIVFVPRFAFLFESWFDWVEITVK